MTMLVPRPVGGPSSKSSSETNLTNLPLIERKKVLSEIIPTNDIIKINESFDDGIALFDTAKKLGLEGIFA